MMHSAHPDTHLLGARENLRSGVRVSILRRLQRGAMETLCAGVVILTFLGPAHAEEAPAPDGMLSPPAAEIPAPTPAAVEPVTIDPFIELRGSVWRTKAGIVFLKTPVGLLTLTSKTTLKDLKASQEVRFWVHERHSVVEIRKRADGSLVHRYLSGPMTSGTDVPKTLRWWGPDGDQIVPVGAQEARLSNFREGDPLTVEVDETNTITGVHDLQFDLQVSQTPPAGADVQLLLSGTVSKLKSNFVFVQTPIGLVMLNSKIGVPRVKVGQPLTLHIDHEHVTVTLPSTESPQTRHTSAPPNH
ncbi:MAG TPA: hypothetical protein VFV44_09305 [Nitrospiraceae bacterium]|jgi:hypothetical protein|nr:hypothetical protein [Nitrospiraceae bacterium]